MSTEMDFKSLWNKQSTSDMPDTKELFSKADGIKKKTRNKLIGLNLALLVTTAIMVYMWFNIDNERLTTKIGLILIVVAMVSYLAVSNQIMPLLFKSDFETSSQEYLNQLIRIKRKQDFLNKVMINIYFILLAVGLALYMLQFVARMNVVWAVTYVVLTFGWIGFAWFYMRPRGIRKKAKALNDMIEKLEEVNRQLRGE
jgi:Flp pilus assembly protein TadB